ncbi:MAG: glycine cleavage system aminomethyltransferase GcvT [Actinomycetota bacterium]|nr:glycine cleavage system aminomethyltransferase GcvT [Actinomycetota bacterium]
MKRTHLWQEHVNLGAKMVPFGGWEMPLSYKGGTVAEHMACRSDAVVFDVSHLGTVRLEGAESFDLLQRSFTNDLNKIGVGRAQYTHHLNPEGSVVDDIIVWWVADDRFDVMPNASNTSSVIGSIGGVDVTSQRCVLAVQGPNARVKVAKVDPRFAAVKRFHVERFDFQGVEVVVAGTGYTGEDGIEIAVPNAIATELFNQIIAAEISPAGLGARDTLRLEAALPLHGHELGDGITSYQANLGWVVALDKGAFIGRDALVSEKESGLRRHLVGVVGDSRQPFRDHMTLSRGGEILGEVTSGNFSPVLGKGIAIAFSNLNLEEGTRVEVTSGDRSIPGTIVKMPFVAKKK